MASPNASPVATLLKPLEKDGHNPNCFVIWVVLLIFTLVEIGWASTLPLVDLTVKDEQVKDWSALCKSISAEARNDKLAAEARKAGGATAAGERPLVASGRPGARLLELVGPEAAELIQAGAEGELSNESKTAVLKAINDEVLENVAFYQDESFANIVVGTAIKKKLSGLRQQKPSQWFFTFLGEASIDVLNRRLLESAYPDAIGPVPFGTGRFLLIGGLMFFAILKAMLVAAYFMHAKYEGNWLHILMIPSSALAFVVVVFLAPDVGGVHHKDWVWTFLVPMIVLIFACLVAVMLLVRTVKVGEPADAAHGH